MALKLPTKDEFLKNGIVKVQCDICLEDYDNLEHFAVQVECGHSFGKSCLVHWLEDSNTCPLCRGKLFIQETVYVSGKQFTLVPLAPLRDDSLLAEQVQHYVQKLWTALSSKRFNFSWDIFDLITRNELFWHPGVTETLRSATAQAIAVFMDDNPDRPLSSVWLEYLYHLSDTSSYSEKMVAPLLIYLHIILFVNEVVPGSSLSRYRISVSELLSFTAATGYRSEAFTWHDFERAARCQSGNDAILLCWYIFLFARSCLQEQWVSSMSSDDEEVWKIVCDSCMFEGEISAVFREIIIKLIRLLHNDNGPSSNITRAANRDMQPEEAKWFWSGLLSARTIDYRSNSTAPPPDDIESSLADWDSESESDLTSDLSSSEYEDEHTCAQGGQDEFIEEECQSQTTSDSEGESHADNTEIWEWEQFGPTYQSHATGMTLWKIASGAVSTVTDEEFADAFGNLYDDDEVSSDDDALSQY